MAEKNFRCWVPIDKIEKAKDADGNPIMKFAGFASTKREDTDGETLDPKNFDISYLKERGVINYNHSKKPSDIIGEPSKVEIRPEGLWIEAQLYPDSELAKSVYKLGQTLQKHSKKRRLGFSIEGQATERSEDDPSKVLAARITGCAITPTPKNCDSVIDIVKGHISEIVEEKSNSINQIEEVNDLIKAITTESKNIIDIVREDGMHVTVNENYDVKIEKSLSAGEVTGRDTTNSTVDSGAPLKTESVDGETKKDKKKKKPILDDEEQELADGGGEFLEKSEVFEKIFSVLPGIGLEKAEEIYSTLNNLTMKSDKTKITEDVLEKALANLKLKKGDDDDSDDMEESEKPTMKKGEKKEDIKKKVAVKKEEKIEKGAKATKKLDDEADKEDDEDEDDEEQTKESEKEELKKSVSKDKMKKAAKLDDEADKEDDEDEDDEEESDESEKEELKKGFKAKDKKKEDKEEDKGGEEDEEDYDDEDEDEGDGIEKALRDTSHLSLVEGTDKNGKKTRKWMDKTKGDKHHDIKPGSAVKYEHYGKIHEGGATVKRVAPNGSYIIDTKKHGTIDKHPHQIKKTTGGSDLKKGFEGEALLEGYDFSGLEKSIDSITNIFGSKFQSLGVLLKGVYDNQIKSSEEIDSLKEDLEKSLEEIDLLKGMIDEIGNVAPAKKSVTTSRERKFVQGDEIKKGIEAEAADNNEGKIVMSIAKNKQRILGVLDQLTFEKGLDNELANGMVKFESSSILTDYAKAKLASKNIKIIN